MVPMIPCPCCGADMLMADLGPWNELSRSQLTIMETLASARGRTVTLDTLAARVWEFRDEPDEAYAQLRVQIHRIRRKIGGDVIENTYGGYRLRADPKPMLDIDIAWFDGGESEA